MKASFHKLVIKIHKDWCYRTSAGWDASQTWKLSWAQPCLSDSSGRRTGVVWTAINNILSFFVVYRQTSTWIVAVHTFDESVTSSSVKSTSMALGTLEVKPEQRRLCFSETKVSQIIFGFAEKFIHLGKISISSVLFNKFQHHLCNLCEIAAGILRTESTSLFLLVKLISIVTVTFIWKSVQINCASVRYRSTEVPSDIVLLASVDHDHWFAEEQFAAECDTVRMREHLRIRSKQKRPVHTSSQTLLRIHPCFPWPAASAVWIWIDFNQMGAKFWYCATFLSSLRWKLSLFTICYTFYYPFSLICHK